MIELKTEKDIKIMQKGGKILKTVLDFLLSGAKEGVSLLDLDKIAEAKIKSLGGESSFKKVPGYRWTCCFSVNDIVVHGIPTEYKIREGDVVGIDCGVYYQGFHTDSAWTILIESSKFPASAGSRKRRDKVQSSKLEEKRKFLAVGEKALNGAIKQVKIGNRIGHISQTIQEIVEKGGYSVVKSLTGHGVGRNLHESPEIPGILSVPMRKTPLISRGMVLAIEVIYNMGSFDIVYKNDDGWTIATQDGKISGLFEKTVAVSSDGVFVLT